MIATPLWMVWSLALGVASPLLLAQDAEPVRSASATETTVPGKRLTVLFIGDHGHHQPRERLHDVYGPLLRRGFAIDWEDELEYVTAKRLLDYDAVVMYANQAQHAVVPPDFFQALQGFVRAGGGFVALHCTSGCFMQSDEWLEFVGARFVSHGGEIFQQEIVTPEHAIVKDWPNFESWDETYVQKHAPRDRVVLTVRGVEPWSWVRAEGAGRVFYSASGHDARTWQQPAFLDLLVRAIDWTAGEDAAQARAAYREPTFAYGEHDWVPNYEGRQPKMKLQKPSTPEQAEAALIVPAGFEAVLFASEPMIVNPIAMTWDESGRCWVIESPDYPNRVEEGHQGSDRISILEDTDGDGRADKKTVFKDGLNLPTSLMRVADGVYVAQAPDLLHLRDTNGDDRCDESKVLFTGFGRWDTHAGPSNLQWGPDNFVWGAVGYSGFEGAAGNKFGSGLWRWKSGMAEPEFLAQFTNNTWGLGFRDDGEVFGSTANGAPSFFVGATKNILKASAPDAAGALPAFDSASFHPALAEIRQGDFFGQYTSAAGHHFATGAAMPPGWADRTAFVCGPTGHLVGRFNAVPDGSGYRTQNAFNLCTSIDEWFCPVQAEVGPDDAVWIADFAQFIILHNLPGNPERGLPKIDYGDGNAHLNPLRDNSHGRIFRIARKGWSSTTPAVMDTKTIGSEKWNDERITQTLEHPNRFWRTTARRQMLQTLPSKLTETHPFPVEQTRVRLGFRGHESGESWKFSLGKTIAKGDRSEKIAALEGLKYSEQDALELAASGLLDSPDLVLRRHALIAATRMAQSDALGVALASLALKPMEKDTWLPQVLAAAVAAHADPFLAAAEPLLPADSGAKPANLFPNPSFELADPEQQDQPMGWKVRTYGGSAKHTWEHGLGRGGSRALVIHSEPALLQGVPAGADTSWCTDVAVEPNTRYRLSGWIKTSGVTHAGGTHGALFNIHPRHVVTQNVQDNSDWTQVSLEFETGPNERSVSINCLYGGWGWSTGTALYDDLELFSLGAANDLRSLVALARRFASDAPSGTQESTSNADLLTGGDVAAGRQVFFEQSIVACFHCHVYGERGGKLGPDLTDVASRLSKEKLLESILDPNAELAKDWPAKASAMPALRAFLTDDELRDLIAFLSHQRD